MSTDICRACGGTGDAFDRELDDWAYPRRDCERCGGTGVAEQRKCRSGCPTRDHATWGECVRAARINVDRTALAAGRDNARGR